MRVDQDSDLSRNQISFEKRAKQIEEQERQEQEAAEMAKKNKEFFMVFKDTGGPAMRKLIEINPNSAILMVYLGEQMDRSNAVVASGKALAVALNMSESTMSRAINDLVSNNYVKRFKSGGTNVFVSNPEYVWNAWATGKKTCLFNNAKLLISENEQDPETVVKNFPVVMEKQRRASDKSAEISGKKPVGRPRKIREEMQAVSA